MKYIKYINHFESVNSSSVENLLKSYGFYSEDEISELIEDSLLSLKDYIQYLNDEFDREFITLIPEGTGYLQYFDKYNKERKSNIQLNNQVLSIDMRFGNKLHYKTTSNITYKDILDRLNVDFKVVYQHLIQLPLIFRENGFEEITYYLLINLIPENLTYYEIYGYSQGKMKAGDCYRIKPLYPMFKDNYTDSLNYSSELIREFSVKLNHLRVLYDVGFSYDGKVIDIRILPK
jgi:hypothetical protein